MKILNLFAGIGGNRTLWGDKHEITAVEHDQRIAMIYLKRFPNDKVIVGDAYEYLEEHYKEFDFIWASPPCQSHTCLLPANFSRMKKGRLPDLRLYSIIIFLKKWDFKGKWIVENVVPYYEPLIRSTSKVGRHYVWSNFYIKKNLDFEYQFGSATGWKYSGGTKDNTKTQEERNAVDSKIGKYILDCLLKPKQMNLEFFK
jgi:DNA (cytosine-5)-methyltransferase 1